MGRNDAVWGNVLSNYVHFIPLTDRLNAMLSMLLGPGPVTKTTASGVVYKPNALLYATPQVQNMISRGVWYGAIYWNDTDADVARIIDQLALAFCIAYSGAVKRGGVGDLSCPAYNSMEQSTSTDCALAIAFFEDVEAQMRQRLGDRVNPVSYNPAVQYPPGLDIGLSSLTSSLLGSETSLISSAPQPPVDTIYFENYAPGCRSRVMPSVDEPLMSNMNNTLGSYVHNIPPSLLATNNIVHHTTAAALRLSFDMVNNGPSNTHSMVHQFMDEDLNDVADDTRHFSDSEVDYSAYSARNSSDDDEDYPLQIPRIGGLGSGNNNYIATDSILTGQFSQITSLQSASFQQVNNRSSGLGVSADSLNQLYSQSPPTAAVDEDYGKPLQRSTSVVDLSHADPMRDDHLMAANMFAKWTVGGVISAVGALTSTDKQHHHHNNNSKSAFDADKASTNAEPLPFITVSPPLTIPTSTREYSMRMKISDVVIGNDMTDLSRKLNLKKPRNAVVGGLASPDDSTPTAAELSKDHNNSMPPLEIPTGYSGPVMKVKISVSIADPSVFEFQLYASLTPFVTAQMVKSVNGLIANNYSVTEDVDKNEKINKAVTKFYSLRNNAFEQFTSSLVPFDSTEFGSPVAYNITLPKGTVNFAKTVWQSYEIVMPATDEFELTTHLISIDGCPFDHLISLDMYRQELDSLPLTQESSMIGTVNNAVGSGVAHPALGSGDHGFPHAYGNLNAGLPIASCNAGLPMGTGNYDESIGADAFSYLNSVGHIGGVKSPLYPTDPSDSYVPRYDFETPRPGDRQANTATGNQDGSAWFDEMNDIFDFNPVDADDMLGPLHTAGSVHDMMSALYLDRDGYGDDFEM